MGAIVEFYSSQRREDIAKSFGRGSPPLVGSISINSHMIEAMLAALSGTDLKGLVGDGSDAARSLFVPLSDLTKLKAQIAALSQHADELLCEIFEAIEDAIDEAVWAKRGLLIVLN
jgi:hypothetical protein